VREDFVFRLTRQQYEAQYGTQYRKPGFFTRVLFFILKIVPKVGPFKPLAFEPLTPEAERLFTLSFTTARERYRAWVLALRKSPLSLANIDLDTGEPPDGRENPLAAETRADLASLLAERKKTVGATSTR
jgi:hypothetical protein